MANALKTLFQDIADAIKEKTGETESMKPAEFPAKIAAIPTGGGGSVAGAVTVTFCNYDGTELYSRQVFIGDDCPDPVTQGKIPTPTKESTAQYDYTHNGWSTTAGGETDQNALKNITEDRTVYSAYSRVIRYYNAKFYDSDGTLMKAVRVAYGSQAVPPDTGKEGYSFVGWTPSNLVIYGDTDFYGEWESDEGWLVYKDFPSETIETTNYTYSRVRYSPDGSRMYVACDTKIYIYDATVQPYSLLLTRTLPYRVADMEVSPDGAYLAVSINYNTSTISDQIYIYETTGYGRIFYSTATGTGSRYPLGIAFNSDGTKLFVTYSNVAVCVEISLSDMTFKTLTFSFDGGNPADACFSPDGKNLSIAARYNYRKMNGYLFDIVDGEYVADTNSKFGNTSIGMVNKVSYSADGKYLAFVSDYNSNTREFVVFDTTTSPYTRVVNAHYDFNFKALAFSHDNSMLAVGISVSPYIKVFDTTSWTEMDAPLVLPTESVNSITFNHDDTRLAMSVNGSDKVNLYEVRK